MPYQLTIASKIVQFGQTVIEYNLTDSDGVMPTIRNSYKWKTTHVTNPMLNKAKKEVINKFTEDYQNYINKEEQKSAFKEKLTNYLEQRIAVITEQYLDKIESSGMTEKQKEYARRISFNFTIE